MPQASDTAAAAPQNAVKAAEKPAAEQAQKPEARASGV
jgi:hypothetical protein